jgi:nitrile hydratase
VNGIHDLGGMDGFGRVEVEAGEPVFHAPWERTVFGITTAVFLARTRAELDARARGGFALGGPVAPQAAADVRRLAAAAPDAAAAPRFAAGDRVVVRNVQTHGHTRCPRYVRGKRGVVVRVDRPYSLPDLEAHGDEVRKEPTYAVRFTSAELWGAAATPGDTVTVDEGAA